MLHVKRWIFFLQFVDHRPGQEVVASEFPMQEVFVLAHNKPLTDDPMAVRAQQTALGANRASEKFPFHRSKCKNIFFNFKIVLAVKMFYVYTILCYRFLCLRT